MNKTRNIHIWIEAEEWPVGEWVIEDTNLDVIVTFSDRAQWTAHFFTYKNIQSLQEKNKKTGECMSGTYFWARDMVLIDTASRERIYELINTLLNMMNLSLFSHNHLMLIPKMTIFIQKGFLRIAARFILFKSQ